ncbi:MAG: hypothetical protein LUI04_00865 [Porphyromonadaceae bacterium]|nr:hypothetical protein [Porphyromonadaceae bacterium]
MKLHYILLALPFVWLASCINDKSTDADKAISEITIVEGTIEDVYNIDKNDTLIITPQITQTMEKEVSYTWEIDQEVYSTDPEFYYVGKSLGTFQCRLILENEDGKTFFPFTIYVNSPYEEGIVIISKDAEGKSMLSFMLGNSDGTDSGVFDSGDCFSINNDDIDFASNVSDIVQCSGSLIITCQGSGVGNDVATLYYLNEKTLIVENMVTVTEYSDFIPTKMIIPSVGYSGGAHPILCENGKIYEFSTTEGVLAQATKLQSTYSQSCGIYDDGTLGNYYSLFWDEEVGGLCLIYKGYGPYYCSSTYHLERSDCSGSDNYFNGYDFVGMFIPRLTTDQKTTTSPEVVVVTSSGVLYQKVRLNAAFWVYNYDTSTNVLVDNGGKTMAGMGSINFKTNSPCVANMTYYSLLFGDTESNNVYRWNYTSSELLSAAKVLTTVGSDNAIVTAMEISADHTRTYIAYYEPEEEGLNGHVTVINTDTGEKLAQYDNVSYQPVKIMYKTK